MCADGLEMNQVPNRESRLPYGPQFTMVICPVAWS